MVEILAPETDHILENPGQSSDQRESWCLKWIVNLIYQAKHSNKRINRNSLDQEGLL